jgi:hypothetical protein
MIGHFTAYCPNCKKFVCGRSTCDCSCDVMDEDDAAHKGRMLLAWRPVLMPVFWVINLCLTAILTPVLWAARWYTSLNESGGQNR